MSESQKTKKDTLLSCARTAREVMSLPKIVINIDGDSSCYQSYLSFTKRHPRLKLVRNKSIGVALLVIPDTLAEFLTGKKMKTMRKRVNKAQKNGFTCRNINPSEHLDEILNINTSMGERQGKPMSKSYLSIEELSNYFKDKQKINGVFDQNNILKAYLSSHFCGEVCIMDRILGYGDDLNKGIMYFLMSEKVQELIQKRQSEGMPNYLMYDTWFGAPPGLLDFKKGLGFNPYRVVWRWEKK